MPGHPVPGQFLLNRQVQRCVDAENASSQLPERFGGKTPAPDIPTVGPPWPMIVTGLYVPIFARYKPLTYQGFGPAKASTWEAPVSTELFEAPQRLTQALIAWRSRPGDKAAEHDLWTACRQRMQFLASRLLDSSPRVRRWEETDDLVQNALVRLVEAIKGAVIESDRHLLNLAAKKIREEFIDKLRHYSGPRSPMRYLATSSQRGADGERLDLVEQAVAAEMTSATEADRWERFHEVVGRLPEREREVFELTWYLGADQDTIARTIDSSIPTVKRAWKSAKELVAKGTQRP